MVNSSKHWEKVALQLAERYTVIAPDLLGHGDSASIRGDYSLGAHASSIRDLLTTIGVERATIVGHSLGGGIAMVFFYQFPQRVERLALISSGGLGHEVSPMLRGRRPAGRVRRHLAGRQPPRPRDDRTRRRTDARSRKPQGSSTSRRSARAMRPLQEAAARRAFLQTLRSVIDVRGQHVSAVDRLYLLGELPTLIVWGERDHTIPIEARTRGPRARFRTAASSRCRRRRTSRISRTPMVWRTRCWRGSTRPSRV